MHTYANSQSPYFYSNLTKDLQLKRSSLGSEGMGKGGVNEVFLNQAVQFLKVLNFSLMPSLPQLL
jgi:hypothetical protein